MQSSEDVAVCDLQSVKIFRKSAILRNRDVTAYYKFIFDQCDTNHDGQISILELKEFLANNEGEVPTPLVKCVHNCFDKDHDQKLDFNEFLDMINHPRFKETFQRLGSRYLQYVAESSVRRRELKVRRTITNTGLYEEQYAFNQYTLGLILISVIQIICFYVDKRYGGIIKEYTRFDPSKRFEVWRYVSHLLVHGDCTHLWGNVVMQLLIGLPLEMVHTWRVPVIYCAGVVGGALLHFIFRPTTLIGASAGLYAFYSGHCAAVILNWNEMSHPLVPFLIFGMLIVFDVIRNTIMYYTQMHITSYVAHVGGTIIGLPFGLIILKNLKVNRVEMIVWYASVVVLSLLLLVLVTLTALDVRAV